MARINFEDDVESREEFRKLVRLLQGDDDRARGMLIRFWRIAQREWAEFRLVSQHEMDSGEFQILIDSRWALHFPNGYTEQDGTESETVGYYAIGSEERFAWYRQKVQAGIKRGRAARGQGGQFTSGSPAAHAPAGAENQRRTIPDQPPSPSPSPSPVPVPALSQKKEREIQNSSSAIPTEARSEWERTLTHFRLPINWARDEGQLYRAGQRVGFDWSRVKNALRGFRKEEKSQKYDPAKHCHLSRLNNTDKFNYLETLGAVPESAPVSSWEAEMLAREAEEIKGKEQ